MSLIVDRRTFAGSLLAAPLAIAPAIGARSADPGAPAGRLRVTCNLYSFNAPLVKHSMSLEEVMDFCAAVGFDAVDPTGYYFSTYPETPPTSEIDRIKRHAFRLGLDLTLTGVRNDFTVTEPSRVDAELALVTRWLAVASRLGAPALRVFAGGSTTEPTAPGALDRVVSCLERAVVEAERHGVLLVLQNHNDALKTADQALEIRRRVPSEWLGLNVDIGSLRTANPYEETARLAPHAYAWQVKERVARRQVEEDTDLAHVARIIRDSGFSGYVAIETLGEGDPKEKVRRMFAGFRAALGA